MSSPLDSHIALANAQGAAFPDAGELPWTGARPQDYTFLSQFLVGRDNLRFYDAGTSIKTKFQSEIASTQFGPKRPAADHRRGMTVDMGFLETDWTEYEWNAETTWHELNLQGAGILSAQNSQKFWSIIEEKMRAFKMDPLKKMEKAIAATPTEAMFDTGGTGIAPIKSIFTGCNVWTTDHGVAAEGLFPGMTSQQGLDPSADKYKRVDSFGVSSAVDNYNTTQLAATKVYYDTAGGNLAANGTGSKHLFEQMQYLMDFLSWKPTPMAGEFAGGMEIRPRQICCTHEAKRLYAQSARAHGELFATMAPNGDPSMGATAHFGGIPLEPSSSLRDARIYPDISGGASDAVNRAPVHERDVAGTPGAYFHFFDPQSVNLWFHSDRSWEEDEWMSMAPINKDVMFKLGRFQGNLHFSRYMTNGILAPSTAITNYA